MPHIPLAAHLLRRTLPVMILIAAPGATCELARAEYPERQITMIVCFPAGGGYDIGGRLFRTPVGEALGKPGNVENRGGAGGYLGLWGEAGGGLRGCTPSWWLR